MTDDQQVVWTKMAMMATMMNNDGNDVFRAGRSRGCMLGGRQAAWRNPWTGSLVLPGAPIQPPPMLDLVPDAEITPPMLEPARRSRDGSQDCSLQQRRLCRDATQDHDIWLLFTINTYLMPDPPICPSLCPRVWENLVSPDWFRPSRQMFRSHESRQSGQMFNHSGK